MNRFQVMLDQPIEPIRSTVRLKLRDLLDLAELLPDRTKLVIRWGGRRMLVRGIKVRADGTLVLSAFDPGRCSVGTLRELADRIEEGIGLEITPLECPGRGPAPVLEIGACRVNGASRLELGA